MTKVHVHELTGLTPDALATYLAALGVLRLLAEQRDPDVRGFWRDEHFVLVTKLSEDEVQEFFLNEYAPSPILAPWNGGGGFLDTDGDADEAGEDERGEVSTLEKLKSYRAQRFAEIQRAIEQAQEFIPGSLVEARRERDRLTRQLSDLRRRIKGLTPDSVEHTALADTLRAVEADRNRARKRVDAVKDQVKAKLLQQVANAWSGSARDWFDSCIILDQSGLPNYAFHVGSGGNEGNQDYTAGFQRNLTLVFDPDGSPSQGAFERLKAALFGHSARVLDHQAAGQFFPGRAGGTNMGAGFGGGAQVNPWEFILMLEGAVALVAGMSRRGQVGWARVASPFWVEAAAAGFGSASEREGSPRGEQWLPLWSQPVRYAELVELVREARAQVGGRQTTRASDIVRATARLGIARGIDSLQRFAYLERNGQSNLAVFAGRFHVRSRPHQGLLEEIAPWIDSLVAYARPTKDNNVPASLGRIARRAQDALFSVCRRDATARDWRALLVTLGEAELALLRSGKSPARRPLPPLSGGWIAAVDDGTPQGRRVLRLALAFASQHRPVERENGEVSFADSIRRHFIPLDEGNTRRPRFKLDDKGHPEADPECVCLGRDLVADAVTLVKRRSIGARSTNNERVRAPRLPLHAWPGCEVTLEEVGAWIRGEVVDNEILALVRPFLALDFETVGKGSALPPPDGSGGIEPLHLLFRLAHLPFDVPVADPERRNETAVTVRLDPEPVRRLATGDLDGALRVVVRRLEASGLRPVFRRAVGSRHVARRLAASLAFPISQNDAARAARLVCKPYAVKDVEDEPAVPA
ncbi:MAG: hypothetical protein KatS3mg012_1168 [Gaiellaceae bacterium]|nr:MAG: hypothetical protein KatS3mg012_1168 [Gaiellaceae bacterium]